MNHPLTEILSAKSTNFDAVRDAQELQAVLAALATKTPSFVTDVVSPSEIMRKTDNPDPTPATDPSTAELRKLHRAE
jgi:hypothetical protein